MKTEKELNKEIVDLTMEIRNDYPELTKYLEELTVSIPDSGQLNIKALDDYRNTLKSMMEKYKNEILQKNGD